MAAVQQNGHALQYVKNQTYDICITAVQQNGIALEYVKNQTDNICMAAVQQDGYALKYVKNITNQIYINTKSCNIKYELLIDNPNLLILCRQFLNHQKILTTI